MAKKDNQKEKAYSKDEVLVMFEKLGGKISIIAEGIKNLDEKMDRGFEDVGNKINKLELGLDLFKIDTKNNFKIILDYLSRLDNEMKEISDGLEKFKKEKVSKKEFSLWQKKVLNNEKEIEKLRSVIMSAVKGGKLAIGI